MRSGKERHREGQDAIWPEGVVWLGKSSVVRERYCCYEGGRESVTRILETNSAERSLEAH